jgi:hypothetical protein
LFSIRAASGTAGVGDSLISCTKSFLAVPLTFVENAYGLEQQAGAYQKMSGLISGGVREKAT